MNETREYRRGTESITVMSYLAAPDDSDGDEIRVLRQRDGVLVEDRIAFFGPGGRQWLLDRHEEWTADGYERLSPPSV
jgi:hypothetical protein